MPTRDIGPAKGSNATVTNAAAVIATTISTSAAATAAAASVLTTNGSSSCRIAIVMPSNDLYC